MTIQFWRPFILAKRNILKLSFRNMSLVDADGISLETRTLLERAKLIVPEFTDAKHKGSAGRIGVIGGSLEYTGAPYFAAISALRVGADLVHVFCHKDASTVIKSYSPELIVHPVLDASDAVELIQPWLERLHVMVIGPGLGRERAILNRVAEIIVMCRKASKPMVIDADGLFLISQNMDLIKGYDKVVLTPNAIEFTRLFGPERELFAEKLKHIGNGVTILEKGPIDRIHATSTREEFQLVCGGSGRRCGGQGDILCGSLATFYHWALNTPDPNPSFTAAFAAAFLTRMCNAGAFAMHGRSMLATDMIAEIHKTFEKYFEHTENSDDNL